MLLVSKKWCCYSDHIPEIQSETIFFQGDIKVHILIPTFLMITMKSTWTKHLFRTSLLTVLNSIRRRRFLPHSSRNSFMFSIDVDILYLLIC
jgi:hypothetical protein